MKNITGTGWRALKVGLVLTLALLLLLWAVTNSNYLKRLVTQDASLYARVPTVNGLHRGAPVWLQGIRNRERALALAATRGRGHKTRDPAVSPVDCKEKRRSFDPNYGTFRGQIRRIKPGYR